MIGKAVYSILYADANVEANVSTRIFPSINYKATNTYPYLVYHHTIDEPNDTKSGVSTLNTATIQVNTYDVNKMDSETLAEYVRIALDRKSGTYGTIVVQSVQYTDQSDAFDLTGYEDFDGVFQISQTFKIRYEPIN